MPELPTSIWAAVSPPGPKLEVLDGDTDADVVVIGAGFTGLSTALHLARDDVDVAVLEAVEPGWGASGRNNGQVIPTLTRPEPNDIINTHGAAGERFVEVLRDSADYLFDIVQRFGLAAEAEQTGWIQPVHTPGRMKIAERRVQQWSKHGAPVELLSRDEVGALTGSELWHGGWANPTGGHINPLALARELARAAVASGARVFQHTAARSLRYSGQAEGGRWIVETSRGQVSARRLMLATNAYTGEFTKTLVPEVAREVVPIVSWQLATKPLGDNLRHHIIPGRQAVSDTHGDLHFTRYDARNRLITGGALIIAAKGKARMKSRIGARLKRMFAPIGAAPADSVSVERRPRDLETKR